MMRAGEPNREALTMMTGPSAAASRRSRTDDEMAARYSPGLPAIAKSPDAALASGFAASRR